VTEKVCKKCKRVLESSDVCPTCKTSDTTTHWKGYVIVIDPERSEVAKEVGASFPGRYALRLSR
jgi:DNA-directed RNA polymerase subunit E"